MNLWARRLGPGVIVAGLYLWLDGFALFRMAAYQLGRADVGTPWRNTGAFVGTYLMSLFALAVLHTHDRKTLRWPTHALAFVALGAYFGFERVNGRGFTTSEANLLWGEIEYVPSALRFFFRDYASVLLASAAGIVVFDVWVRWRPTGIRTLWALVLPIIAGALCLQILSRTDSKVEQFPLTLRVPTLTAYAYFHQSIYTGKREPVAFEPEGAPLADHIVFIVDESIRGDWLSLNGAPLRTTPYLESIEGRLFNYGVASAAANLSAPANIIVQSGLRPEELPDTELRSLKNPNVFSYLQRAGYFSTLVNAQNVLRRPPNFMSESDIADLDAYVQLRERDPGRAEHEVDFALPALLAEIVTRHERSFTFVIKNGAHFPYDGKFPEADRVFTSDRWTGSHEPRRAFILANYMNTLRWTVDRFHVALVDALEGKAPGILLVYTADHAQSLYEPTPDGGKAIRGHGHHDSPPSEQARIPLFLLPLDDALHARIEPLYDPALRDRVSAFSFFSTLLRLGGYGEAQLAARYAPSLFARDAVPGDRVFVSGNHFGADGPLYRDAPYRSSFLLNRYEP